MEITEAMREKAKTAALQVMKKMQEDGFTEMEAWLTAVKLKDMVTELNQRPPFIRKFAENLSLEEI